MIYNFNKKELFLKNKEENENLETDLILFYSQLPFVKITEDEIIIEITEIYERLTCTNITFNILENILKTYYSNSFQPPIFSWDYCYVNLLTNETINKNLLSFNNNYNIDYGIILQDEIGQQATFYSNIELTGDQIKEIQNIFYKNIEAFDDTKELIFKVLKPTVQNKIRDLFI